MISTKSLMTEKYMWESIDRIKILLKEGFSPMDILTDLLMTNLERYELMSLSSKASSDLPDFNVVEEYKQILCMITEIGRQGNSE